MRASHIIFDCDGVLLDSEEISMRVDQLLLEGCGVKIPSEDMHRRFVGKTFLAMIAELEAERGLSLPADLERRKDGLMLDIYRRELKPVTNVADALAAITLPKSIGTNGPRARALAALDITGIGHHFGQRITTFEDVKNGKPAPDIYLLAADRAGFAPQYCAVIEDSVTGMSAAVTAGCLAIGFTGTHADKAKHAARLKVAGARLVFDDMADLPCILDQFT